MDPLADEPHEMELHEAERAVLRIPARSPEAERARREVVAALRRFRWLTAVEAVRETAGAAA